VKKKHTSYVTCCKEVGLEINTEKTSRFEIFMVVKVEVTVFWVVIVCSVVVGYQLFQRTQPLPRSSKMLVSYHNTTQHHNPYDFDLNREN